MTIDAGPEDGQVKRDEGLAGMRQGRILRVLDEALEQGGVLTQEDLTRVLHVDVRTIRRDIRTLKAAGHLVHTRGQLKGAGGGQTHKVRIIELWLDREGYDKIARPVGSLYAASHPTLCEHFPTDGELARERHIGGRNCLLDQDIRSPGKGLS